MKQVYMLDLEKLATEIVAEIHKSDEINLDVSDEEAVQNVLKDFQGQINDGVFESLMAIYYMQGLEILVKIRSVSK